MADFTPNYNLKKPLRTEYYNVADANGNSDIVDAQLKAVNDRVGLVEGEVDALENGKVDKVVGKQLSDENYTLIEKNKVSNLPTDTNAQLADKVQNFKLKNEVVNGDFSQGTTGWTKVGANHVIESDYAKIDITIAGGVVEQQGSNINGEKVYVAFKYKTLSSSMRVSFNGKAFVLPAKADWTLFSVLDICGTALRTIGFTDFSASGWQSFYVDKVTKIRLTNIFGAGNEPTKLEMDELMKVIPNQWWDGELTLTQKQFITWQLNLIRKNTNAIIALGGTII